MPTCVRDRNHRISSRFNIGPHRCVSIVKVYLCQFNSELPAIGHGISCVDHEVQHCIFELVCICDSPDCLPLRFDVKCQILSDRSAQQIFQEVSTLGGEPEDDGTVLAGAHRVFLNLKAVVTGHDDKAIINEVEAGEDHIKAKYEDVLSDRDLSPAVQALISSAYDSVKAGHDEIRDIKHSMES